MRNSVWTLLGSVLAIAACSSSDSSGSAGAPGAGGQSLGQGGSAGAGQGGTAGQAGQGGSAGVDAGTTAVPGFGEVQGECATCLDTSTSDIGVCAQQYSSCLADLGCSKLLKCYRQCADTSPGNDEYGACVSSVGGCEAGVPDGLRMTAQAALKCVCCDIAACKMECDTKCKQLENAAFGPFICN